MTTLADVPAATAPATLRLEAMGLACAAGAAVCGVALTAEAALRRAAGGVDVVRTPEAFRGAVVFAAALVLAGFGLLHLLRRARRQGGDGLLLPCALALCGIGLMTMIAVRDPVREAILIVPFGWGVLLGCAAAGVATTVSFEPLRPFAYLPLAAALVLSAALVLFGRGPGGSGVKVALWGGQPVEAIRLLEVLFLAGYFGKRWEYLRSLRDPFIGRTRLMARLHIPPLDYLLPLLIAVAATLAFYVVQKDLGPALIMACVFLALYATATGRGGLAVAGLVTLVAAFWGGYRLGIPSTVKARVAIWLAPWDNALRGGDQVPQGLWALATGGLTGTGGGLGDARLVPAAHTDFVLAVVGEELGAIGLVAVLLLYTAIVWRALRIALRAEGSYSRFLALGLALGLVLQLILIACGILAVLPLSGVVTPFLSYGKSAMIVNLASIGILLSIASRQAERPAEPFVVPIRRLSFALAIAGAVIAARAVQIQVLAADAIMTRPVLTVLADGTYRFQDNPRLMAAARALLPRGRILDRRGTVLASGETPAGRTYPLGGRAYHVLGDLRTERDWAATNTSFVERDSGTRLRGFDDRAERVTVPHPRGDGTLTLLRRDLSDLIPLVRGRYSGADRQVERLIARPRDVTLTIDARLQAGLADLLRARLEAGGFQRGAALVVDVATRQVLASVSYPWPDLATARTEPVSPEAGLDRARYGLYPPGSAFKLVTAMAALRRGGASASHRYLCERLPDGRVGRRLDGWTRPIRDDSTDHSPHGLVSLDRGLVVSCNAYFAQLGVALGSDALQRTARDFDIAIDGGNARALRATLPFAGFGQGAVVATPARLAQVVATIAAGGVLAPYVWMRDPAPSAGAPQRIISRAAAAELAGALREAVQSGTARVLRGNATAIAGKTGTAELDGQPSHAWFAGFAPYRTSGPRIAFVVLVENGGYGGRSAAPIAGAIVDLARDLGIIQ